MNDFAIKLRPYQQEAVDAVYGWFAGKDGNPLVVVPTGGGKSLIIAAFVHSVLSQWPNERIVILTHVRELIAQNHAALLRAWPSAPAGIYSAGLRRRDHDARILFAGIQSVHDRAELIGWADLVIIDEAHLIPKSGFGMYRTLLDALMSCNSKLKVIGLTATPFRTGEGSLDKGDDRLFHGIAYTCEIVRLINDGWLSHVTAKATVAEINTAGLHVRMGEFVESEMEAVAMADGLVTSQCKEVLARGLDRKSWLVFCCSIAHAERVAAELRTLGISVATVFGDTPKEDRDTTVQMFRDGLVRCVVNVNVLTTGFDAPGTDLIVLLRPTMSPVLYVQMVGRGLRIAEGKENCLVLDFGGNVKRHGPIDAVNIREPKKGEKGAVLARECPTCHTLVSIAVRQCPECGYEWVILDGEVVKPLDEKPGEEEILAGLPKRNPIERWDVAVTRYFRNEGRGGKPATLCVEYLGGFQQRVREWVCFDHPLGSFPRKKAAQWWGVHGGALPDPESVEDARCRIEAGELRRPAGVTVDTRGEWPELRSVRFASESDDSNLPGPTEGTPSDDYSDIPF